MQEENTIPPEQTAQPENCRSKKLFKYTGVGLIVLLCLLMLLVLFRDGIVRFSICRIGSKMTGAEVTLQDFSSSLSGKIHLKDFSIGNPEGYSAGKAVVLKEFFADIDLPSLFTSRKTISKISLRGLQINAESDLSGNNFGKILSNIQNFTSPGKKEEPAAKEQQKNENAQSAEESGFLVSKFVSEDARITYKTTAVNQPVSLPLPPVYLSDIGGKTLQDTAKKLGENFFSGISGTTGSIGDLLSETGQQVNNTLKSTEKEVSNTTKKIGTQLQDAGNGLVNSLKQNFNFSNR